MLLARFKEDRLGVTASSLTFTSLLALVPFFTVALALFTAFPIFGKAQKVLERWLMDSLIPETIARQVLGYLTQFASKASQAGLVGFSILMVTAIALILTIDRTLNNIWRVRQLRPLPAGADLLGRHHAGAAAAGPEPGAVVPCDVGIQGSGQCAAGQPAFCI